MTKVEFAQAVKLAETTDLGHVDDSILYGCLLPNFRPVSTTITVVARTLKDHRYIFGGGWDTEALNELRKCFRYKVEIVG